MSCTCTQLKASQSVPLCGRAAVWVGERELNVHVASTELQWARGLAGYEQTQTDGMLFDMPAGSTFAFAWLNVSVPILIAFYDGAGTIVDVGWLDPVHPVKQPSAPYQYALELIGPQIVSPWDLLKDCASGLRLTG